MWDTSAPPPCAARSASPLPHSTPDLCCTSSSRHVVRLLTVDPLLFRLLLEVQQRQRPHRPRPHHGPRLVHHVVVRILVVLLAQGVQLVPPAFFFFRLLLEVQQRLHEVGRLDGHDGHAGEDGGAHHEASGGGDGHDVAEAHRRQRGQSEVQRREEVGYLRVDRVFGAVDEAGADEEQREDGDEHPRELQLPALHVFGVDAEEGAFELPERLQVGEDLLEPEEPQQAQTDQPVAGHGGKEVREERRGHPVAHEDDLRDGPEPGPHGPQQRRQDGHQVHEREGPHDVPPAERALLRAVPPGDVLRREERRDEVLPAAQYRVQRPVLDRGERRQGHQQGAHHDQTQRAHLEERVRLQGADAGGGEEGQGGGVSGGGVSGGGGGPVASSSAYVEPRVVRADRTAARRTGSAGGGGGPVPSFLPSGFVAASATDLPLLGGVNDAKPEAPETQQQSMMRPAVHLGRAIMA
eukprot:CAMPEP_0194315318 /NCGR_PEP_ID=MMETSP0171-20130528/12114_1 /TAXON_ID=218684 /ORGANISM="Corethron pennatum, Strain L29A3" /LENGTH=464 /DNA_ID=CAMNT_0039071079 /DNA_START=109 /DNA_END=1505 /DNA_ORIENTATION=-